jgi:selenocysteine lyase/cysteine desulfurase
VAFRTGVFSVNVGGYTPHKLADALQQQAGICGRAGVHFAPLAHETIGTMSAGRCRLSFGPLTTQDHLAVAAETLITLASEIALAQ